jgi:hypothetical protein
MTLPEKFGPRHAVMARSQDLYDSSFNDQEVPPSLQPISRNLVWRPKSNGKL